MASDQDAGLRPPSLVGPVERVAPRDDDKDDDSRFLEAVADRLMQSSQANDRQGVITALRALRELDE